MKPSRPSIILFIILACFASRVPLLLNPELILDGDECVIATMAKHWYQGKGYPLFFYGQNYGFAFIEVLCILPFYLVLGFTTYAVKLAMLSLWTVGVVFFYLALEELVTKNRWLSLLITLLLISLPAWAVFSMKAYGGYITAFTITNIVLYLLFKKGSAEKSSAYLWLGILLALLFQAQVLWCAGLAPLLVWNWFRSGSLKRWSVLVLPASIITIAFYFYRLGLPKFNISGRFNPKGVLGHQLARIPEFLYTNMHGRHELWFHGDAGMPNGIFAFIMTATIFFLIGVGIFAFFRQRNSKALFIYSVVGVGFTLFYTIFTYHIQGKYLLPVSALALLSLFLFLRDLNAIKLINTCLIALSVFGMLCISTFKIFHLPRTGPASLAKTIQYLEKNGYRHIYCTHGMLAWQLIFYSNEDVIARPHKFPGRYRSYGLEIDSVLLNGGKTAVVGYADTAFNEYEYPEASVFGNLFIFTTPTKQQLQKRFEFKEGDIFEPYK